MSNAGFKKLLYAQIARLGKAVGNGHRLELLEYLAQGERTVEVLAKLTGLSVANTSQHLQILRQSGLANTRREGLYIHSGLAEPQVVQLIEVMGRLAASQ